MTTKTIRVDVAVGSGATKQTFYRDVPTNIWENSADVLTAIESDKGLNATLKLLNDQEESIVRTTIRAEILKNEAAIAATEEKAIKEYFNSRKNNGNPITMDEARAVMQFMKTLDPKNLPGAKQASA